jgi:hypothetical protein
MRCLILSLLLYLSLRDTFFAKISPLSCPDRSFAAEICQIGNKLLIIFRFELYHISRIFFIGMGSLPFSLSSLLHMKLCLVFWILLLLLLKLLLLASSSSHSLMIDLFITFRRRRWWYRQLLPLLFLFFVLLITLHCNCLWDIFDILSSFNLNFCFLLWMNRFIFVFYNFNATWATANRNNFSFWASRVCFWWNLYLSLSLNITFSQWKWLPLYTFSLSINLIDLSNFPAYRQHTTLFPSLIFLASMPNLWF